jgi:hypothetical protein
MRHRFPPPIIRHAIWLDLRFTQLVRKLLKKRGFAPLLVAICLSRRGTAYRARSYSASLG